MPEGEQHIPPTAATEGKNNKLIVTAVTAGAIAAIVPSIPGAERSADEALKKGDSRIRFETGLHITGALEDSQPYKNFQDGDPDAHAWLHADALVGRLAADPPQVLAVDGFSPVPLGGELDTDFMWVALPARPRRINPLGFYTVSGDNQFIDIGEEISALEGNNFSSEEDAYSKAAAKESDADNSVILKDIRRREKRGLKEIGIGSAIAAGTVAPGIARRIAHNFRNRFGSNERHHGGNTDEADGETPDTAGMKRRTLLRAGVALGAAGATGMLTKGIADGVGATAQDMGQYQAAGTPSEWQKNFWQTVNNYVAEIPEEVSTDGRTAMLIAKQEDAMEYLQDKRHPYLKPDAQGAIVMGATHDYKADRFMKNKDERDEAIREYARHVIQIVDKLSYDTYKLSDKRRLLLTKELLQYMSKVDICHVSDPGLSPDSNLSYYAQQNIKPVDQIESTQMKNALSRVSGEYALKMIDA